MTTTMTKRDYLKLLLENFKVVEWAATIAVFLSCFLFLLHRIDAIETRQEAKFQEQTQRTDRLYEMFYELLKESKGK